MLKSKRFTSISLITLITLITRIALIRAGTLEFDGVPVDITTSSNEDLVIVPGSGGNTQVGDATGTNSHATSNDDLHITGSLEVDSATYLDSTATVAGALTTSARITSSLTTEQLRLSYDDSNYVSFTVDSSGDLTISPNEGTGGITIKGLSTVPNIIAGYSGNSVGSGFGHTISGGGWSGEYPNTVTGYVHTIGGGFDNTITVGGQSATIGGGEHNNIANGTCSTIAGGAYNTIDEWYGFIGGGCRNEIVTPATATNAVLVGGMSNTVTEDLGFIGGGSDNLVEHHYGVIPGGLSNTVSGKYGFAAGRRAKANHQGTFVWADGTDADFESELVDEFAIRAGGGLRVVAAGSNDLFRVYDGTTEALTLLDGGNLGIGTSAPAAKLEILGAGTGTGFALKVQDSSYTDKVAILDNGNVGIGTTAPSTELDVNGTITATAFAQSGTGVIDGSGTASYVPKWSDSNTLTNSLIYDDGTNIGIGTTNPLSKLHSSSTTEQLRLAYDGSNYISFTVDSSGDLSIIPNEDKGGIKIVGTSISPNIIGGYSTNSADGVGNFIGGGGGYTGAYPNAITNSYTDAGYSVIVGGVKNTIDIDQGAMHYIGGGYNNTITGTVWGWGAFIGGGVNNTIESAGNQASNVGREVIVGGSYNKINISYVSGNDGQSFIGGGKGNTISASYAVIPGGLDNTVTGKYGFAAGHLANAAADGVFALTDSTAAEFEVGTENVFGARFSGGYWLTGGNLGVGTSAPLAKLEILGAGTTAGFALKIQDSLYADKVAFLDNGKVGIGTTAPSTELEVDGTITATAFSTALTTVDGHSLDASDGDPADVVYVDADGKVGIGTTTPDTLLHLASSTGGANQIKLGDFGLTGPHGIRFDDDSGNGVQLVWRIGDNQLILEKASDGSNATDAFLYDRDTDYFSFAGNVGIGTTSPSDQLDVFGAGNKIRVSYNASNYAQISADSAGDFNINLVGDEVDIVSSGGGEMRLDLNGVSRTWRLLSDNSPDVFVLADITQGQDVITAEGGASGDLLFTPTGNVGIGTTAPAYDLDLAYKTGASNLYLRMDTRAETGEVPVIRFDADMGTDGDTAAMLVSYNNGAEAIADIRFLRGSTDLKGDIQFETSDAEQMRIDEDGNVGIGTTAPSYNLDVYSPTGNAVGRFETGLVGSGARIYLTGGSSDNGIVYFGDSGDTGAGRLLYDNPGHFMSFYTNNTEKVRIQSDGNVGIGTTGPALPLDVTGSARFSGSSTNVDGALVWNDGGGVGEAGYYEYYDVSDTSWHSLAGGAISYANDIWTQDGTVAYYTTGNVGIGTTNPTMLLDVAGNVNISSSGFLYLDSGGEIRWGDSAQLIEGISSGGLKFYTGGNDPGDESMVILHDGNVGIGTTAPEAPLDVKTDSNGYAIHLEENSDTEDFQIGVNSGGSLVFYDGTTQRMIIEDGTGHVGIGFAIGSNPNSPLHIREDSDDAKGILLQNFGTGTLTQTMIKVKNGAGAGDAFAMGIRGKTYVTNGGLMQDSAYLLSGTTADGGFNIMATHSSAPIRFYSGGYADANLRMIIGATGNIGIGTTGPGKKFEVTDTSSDGTALIQTTTQPFANALTIENFGNDAVERGTGILFRVPTGGNAADGAQIKVAEEVDSATSYMAFSTGITGTLSEQMRITSSGNVGIGTTSPDDKLHIGHSGTVGGLRFSTLSDATNGDSALIEYAESNAAGNPQGMALLYAGDDNPTIGGRSFTVPNNKFYIIGSDGSSDTIAMTIERDGNVGIGTTNPTTKLYVQGTVSADAYAEFSPAFPKELKGEEFDILETIAESAGNPGRADHDKLHPYLQTDQGGRDLSRTVQVLVECVKDLRKEIEQLKSIQIQTQALQPKL